MNKHSKATNVTVNSHHHHHRRVVVINLKAHKQQHIGHFKLPHDCRLSGLSLSTTVDYYRVCASRLTLTV